VKIKFKKLKISGHQFSVTNSDIKLHLIGHLQSNKVKKAMELFHSIHTIDSAKRVNEVLKNINNPNNVCEEYFIELNMANEEQKTGLNQNDLSDLLDLINNIQYRVAMALCVYLHMRRSRHHTFYY
jgi:uncharacterized pyridoxal phosphate-containing UPF0001 family protein